MFTYEMVKLADENGRTYICGDTNEDFMRYSKNNGFHDNKGKEWEVEKFEGYGLSHFIHVDSWKELPPKEMSLEEIEKELGYSIKLDSFL